MCGQFRGVVYIEVVNMDRSIKVVNTEDMYIFWFKYELGHKYHVPQVRSLTEPGFELMTSRSWQYCLYHWDTCSNHLAISDLNVYFWFNYELGQKYHTPQVQPDRGSNSWPPDHDSTLTEYSTLCSNH